MPVSGNPVPDKPSKESSSSTVKIRPAAFLHLLRETLAAPTVKDLENYLQQTPETQDLYFSKEDYTLMDPDSGDDDETSDADKEMMAMMDQMDEELKATSANVSRNVDNSVLEGQAIDDAQVAEDVHILSNLVESMDASAGASGPLRNILGAMGKRVP